jgi:hypothetical protein
MSNEEPEKPTRPRNEMVEVVAELWYCGKILRPHAKRIGQLARDFRDLEATPDEVRRRLKAYKKRWPEMTASPSSLIKNWFEFEPPKKRDASNGAIQSIRQVVSDEQPIEEGEARRLLFRQLAAEQSKQRTA